MEVKKEMNIVSLMIEQKDDFIMIYCRIEIYKL